MEDDDTATRRRMMRVEGRGAIGALPGEGEKGEREEGEEREWQLRKMAQIWISCGEEEEGEGSPRERKDEEVTIARAGSTSIG